MNQFRDVIDDARAEIGDTYEGSLAYPLEDMLRYAVAGVREMWRLRPSLRYAADTGKLYDPDVKLPSTIDENFTVPLPDEARAPLAWYIVFRCLSRDVTDKGNATAASNAEAQFTRFIVG